MRERFQKHDNNFSRASLCLVQCMSWYNGDNTFTLVQQHILLSDSDLSKSGETQYPWHNSEI